MGVHGGERIDKAIIRLHPAEKRTQGEPQKRHFANGKVDAISQVMCFPVNGDFKVIPSPRLHQRLHASFHVISEAMPAAVAKADNIGVKASAQKSCFSSSPFPCHFQDVQLCLLKLEA